MNDRPHFPRATARRRFRVRLCGAVALLGIALFVIAAPAMAQGPAPAPATLPDSAVGRLAGALIRQVDAGDPARVRQWASTALSPSIGADEKAAFVADLASAARDSGGLDVLDARVDPRMPGALQVAVKARRGGRHALFWLVADPAHADQLAQAALAPMDAPALYADWPRKAVSRAELAQRVRVVLDRLAASDDFSGCVTVRAGGRTVFDECRGVAERGFGAPVDGRTRFHVGSINKMFTAVAVAQLVEAGKLSWDDTLARRVPEYPDQAAAGKITVWQLLHHTAGLGDFLVPEYFEHPERFVEPVDYLDLIARQPRVGPPGGDWNYSNAGYMLLGRIIENASGERYFDYLQRHVFASARMDDTGFDSIDDVVPRLAVGYYRDGPFSDAWKAAWRKIGYKGGPAGGGYSTNADLLRFAEALRAGELVKPATLARIFDGQVPAGPGGYAAGFGDRLSHGRHIRGHAGGIEGTTANLQMVWESGAAVALTSNQGPSEHWMLAERIADLLAAADAKP